MPPVGLHEFLIDRYEVTNREYQAFVLAGGYRDQRYWQEPIVRDGRALRWEDAVGQFVDRTGRPGPATWEAGGYPDGQADFPVGGVSWYEAAAYARFASKALPTIYHWYEAASPRGSAWIVPHSNFSRQGPAAAGTYQGLSEPGTYDMAGNVREWCRNESGGERFILGGGWSDADYTFTAPLALSPWDRSPINGLRLVRYLDPADPGVTAQPVVIPQRDFMTEQLVSDEVFAIYRRLFLYDPLPLEPTVRSIDSSSADWVVEDVSFRAAYGTERMAARLFLPRHAAPPFQTVVFFPGSQALFLKSWNTRQIAPIDFVVKSGRAVVYPIYQGTYERGQRDVPYDAVPNQNHVYRDDVIMWGKDLRRAIDYAETRPELDVHKLAYYGFSWGGRVSPIMLVVEPRIRAAVLYLAGLAPQRAQPEADPLNYISRVTTPVLLLSGRYDNIFPLETSALPFFRLLATPAAQKRHVIGQGAHFVPWSQQVRESLDWLDHYLGPVPLVPTPR